MTDKTIKERKADHIAICLEEDVQAQKVSAGFEDVSLVHRALPEVEREKIDISTFFWVTSFLPPSLLEQ